eukprot:858237-Amphidinium_carterae.1
MAAVDVAEVYSPERFKRRALQIGLSTGVAADLSTGWDLSVDAQRQRCRARLEEEAPRLLVASPPCTCFSSLQHLNAGKRDPAK